ncbi:MAG: hypothetical protein IIZ61_05290 [Lachnospiraceae bacterium]|nr:hypothetical protein [Lachnospiraceae bacterium]
MINKKDFEDDNRTIADMSMIEKPTVAGMIFGRRFDAKKKRLPLEGKLSAEPTDEVSVDPDTRRAMVGGAMKASLLIGLVYLVAFGIAIVIMVLIWVH